MGIGPDHTSKFDELATGEVLSFAWRFTCRLSDNREDAEDLLQESLCTALQRLAQLKDNAAFQGWLMSIIHRRFLDNQRRRKSEQAKRVHHLEQFTGVGEPSCLVHPVADHPQAALLADGLNRLPGEQRALLSQHYIEGMPAAELAQVYKISPGALEQRLHRARNSLRRLMEHESQQLGAASKGADYGRTR